ncbi:unnamed protein product, partial [Closterium sp. NIES-54]
MVVYVDDILIFSPSSDLVKEVMLKLQDKFKCKALGDVSFYPGLHIERDVEKRCMRVHQRKYLEALAATFGQSEGHVATPFPSGFKCVKGPEEESVGEEERRRFHSLVGSLTYAAVNTRPDVAFATGQLARVFQCPNEEQVAAGMRMAKYLGQTPTVGLQYSAAAQRRQKGADGVEPGHLFLTAFSDASFASEPEDMTSVGGFICCVGPHFNLTTTCATILTLFCGTTTSVTPPCHTFVACTPISLSLVFPGLCLPFRPRLPRPAFLVSRGGSAPLLTPPRFPLTTAPLQTLHMDMWGPARVSGQDRERYFLLVVDDYTRYTTVSPMPVVDVLIPWIRAVRLQLCERFHQDLPVLHLHSDRGGEFSSDLLRDFCRGEAILQSFTLSDSPQQSGIVEHRIGLVMEVARTSMIRAAAPHFLWPFAVRYAAHQLNLWPRVSSPETSPTLRWTGEVGDASVFRVWGSRAFVRDTSADKLSARAIPC